MITNTGKDILAKYLVGQAPAYASYIAFGCGKQPEQADYQFGIDDREEFSDKKSLDLEMFRSPIISRGFVNNSGVTQVVFTAELPTEERYEVTEVGIFSAASNPAAGTNDSRILFSFTDSENWESHTATESKTIPFYQTALNEAEGGNPDSSDINIEDDVFSANSDNLVFENSIRINRNERARFLNNTIFMKGSFSELRGNAEEDLVYDSPGDDPYVPNHIHLNGVSVNLEKASGKDQLKVAYSVVSKSASQSAPEPTSVSIIVEFASADTAADEDKEYARFKVLNQSASFSSNRYFVATKNLEDLEYSGNFSWNRVSVVKIYASVAETVDNYSDDFYVALDAIRYENTTSQSPLYGLTGYTVVKNSTADGLTAIPIVKEPNTANLLEFRFAMDVL